VKKVNWRDYWSWSCEKQWGTRDEQFDLVFSRVGLKGGYSEWYLGWEEVEDGNCYDFLAMICMKERWVKKMGDVYERLVLGKTILMAMVIVSSPYVSMRGCCVWWMPFLFFFFCVDLPLFCRRLFLFCIERKRWNFGDLKARNWVLIVIVGILRFKVGMMD
jgi:hypothetical protein